MYCSPLLLTSLSPIHLSTRFSFTPDHQYREDEDEMRQVIKSLVALAPELGDVCEAHTFMDGGANGDILQTFALQLVHVLDEEVKRKYPEAKVCCDW